jgi:hypothetical protein
MAPKNEDSKAAGLLAYAEVRDAMEALFINLPDDATITIDGAALGYSEILTRLNEWREELGMRPRTTRNASGATGTTGRGSGPTSGLTSRGRR